MDFQKSVFKIFYFQHKLLHIQFCIQDTTIKILQNNPKIILIIILIKNNLRKIIIDNAISHNIKILRLYNCNKFKKMDLVIQHKLKEFYIDDIKIEIIGDTKVEQKDNKKIT